MNESGNETKPLYRLKDGRLVAGVCTGLAATSASMRLWSALAFALLTAFGGPFVLLYLCAWILIPDETDGASIAETFVGGWRS